MSYSSINTVATVAKREIAVAAKSKGMIVSLALTLILIVGGIAALSYFLSDDSEPSAPRIAATDSAVLEGTGAEVSSVTDRPAAEEAVRNGDVEAALVSGENGWELLADGTASPSISSLVSQAVSAYETNQALAAVGVTPEEFDQAMGPATVSMVDVSAEGEQSEGEMMSTLTALAGIMLLVFSIITFAASIGSRVTEEKSSRVVELILASVRPMDFLAGKIIGNVIFGLACTALWLVAAAISLKFSGLVDGMEFSWAILPILLVSFILGMLFFGSLYAAAGAMVQRTEDLQSTQLPIMLIIFVSMYVPMFGWTSADATWMQAMAWIPPVSITTAPLQYAAGNMSLGEFGLSMLLMAVVTAVVIWLVARIYRASILNNGKKMTWAKALTARPA
ncbi:ABC transporter permease [Corynebacterium tapiri]|uniref:ABC transporter permease n=1 Tax=Corynebacterium tapiri TaxID=1448266 RepID=A0A5C4U6Y9_9CORY|nr:ABC transporter permease [Corynebacterium tapiri]TNM00378.1 ABC transporter permease [Corynebacterium tapiri]